MTRVYLIRHADVENPRRVLYGHLDGFPLSRRGREQATALGRRLRGSGLRRILHSPLERAAETAALLAAQLPDPVPLVVEPELRESEFSRYLQGVPYWQIPIRRPLWIVHKARRGLLPGDEQMAHMGGRILAVMYRVAREHPDEATALVSHADPLQAAWLLLEGRDQNERELYRKPIDKAGTLEVDIEDGRVVGTSYVPPPRLAPSERLPAERLSA
jgi:broad specificity phosphatase PhoE